MDNREQSLIKDALTIRRIYHIADIDPEGSAPSLAESTRRTRLYNAAAEVMLRGCGASGTQERCITCTSAAIEPPMCVRAKQAPVVAPAPVYGIMDSNE